MLITPAPHRSAAPKADTEDALLREAKGQHIADIVAASRRQPLDLRALTHHAGRPPIAVPPSPALAGRRRIVQLQDASPVEIVGLDPLKVGAAVDGVQARYLLDVIDGRPVTLEYVAAGYINPHASIRQSHEQLFVTRSFLDSGWAEGVTDFAAVELDGAHRGRLELESAHVVDWLRRRLEVRVAREACDRFDWTAVDGSIRHLPGCSGALGVVKDTTTQYLGDESELAALPIGSMSSPFVIPRDTRHQQDVYTAYLRLHTVDGQPWTMGLVRLEAADPQLLAPFAAWCWTQRQPAGADARWTCHLKAVADTEMMLKQRGPQIPM